MISKSRKDIIGIFKCKNVTAEQTWRLETEFYRACLLTISAPLHAMLNDNVFKLVLTRLKILKLCTACLCNHTNLYITSRQGLQEKLPV